jgi:hypothetical protein
MYYGGAVMEQHASGEFSRVEFAINRDGIDRAFTYPREEHRVEPRGSLVTTLHCLMGMVETDLIPHIR